MKEKATEERRVRTARLATTSADSRLRDVHPTLRIAEKRRETNVRVVYGTMALENQTLSQAKIRSLLENL